MSDFKEGDLVQLKSGGPIMTVFSVNAAVEAKPAVVSASPSDGAPVVITPAVEAARAQATTVWFTKEGDVRSGNFSVVMLRRHGFAADESMVK